MVLTTAAVALMTLLRHGPFNNVVRAILCSRASEPISVQLSSWYRYLVKFLQTTSVVLRTESFSQGVCRIRRHCMNPAFQPSFCYGIGVLEQLILPISKIRGILFPSPTPARRQPCPRAEGSCKNTRKGNASVPPSPSCHSASSVRSPERAGDAQPNSAVVQVLYRDERIDMSLSRYEVDGFCPPAQLSKRTSSLVGIQ